jgi:hypothetical protein
MERQPGYWVVRFGEDLERKIVLLWDHEVWATGSAMPMAETDPFIKWIRRVEIEEDSPTEKTEKKPAAIKTKTQRPQAGTAPTQVTTRFKAGKKPK